LRVDDRYDFKKAGSRPYGKNGNGPHEFRHAQFTSSSSCCPERKSQRKNSRKMVVEEEFSSEEDDEEDGGEVVSPVERVEEAESVFYPTAWSAEVVEKDGRKGIWDGIDPVWRNYAGRYSLSSTSLRV